MSKERRRRIFVALLTLTMLIMGAPLPVVIAISALTLWILRQE